MWLTKINVDASICKAQLFLGFVLFDHCARYFWSLKLYPTKKFEAVDAEVCAVWEAISHVVQHNYLHVEIKTDNLRVSDTTNHKLHPRSEKVMDNDFWRAISLCCELIGNKDVKVRWIPRELNRAVDYIVNHVKTLGGVLVKGWEELDETITNKTWESMYVVSHVLVTSWRTT
jgi:ribonuclease HI